MEIQHIKEDSKGKFYIEEDGKEIATMTYSKAGDRKIIIDHTFVRPEKRDQGIGEELVNAAADFARKNDIQIVPLCPFAKKVMENDSKYRDVLHS